MPKVDTRGVLIDTHHRTYVNQVFSLLKLNRVSTGLLIDYGFDFTIPKFTMAVFELIATPFNLITGKS